jgi:hypothetical protein
VLLFAAFASIVTPVPPEQAQANVTVRIARPVKVSKDEWVRQPPSRRREKIVVEGGRRLKLRLIEME